MQVIVTFRPAVPTSGVVFHTLRVTLTNASGDAISQDFTAAEVQALAIDNGDGNYSMPVEFPGPHPVGPYSIAVRAVSTAAQVIGEVRTVTGVVPLSEGTWFPAPQSIELA